MQLFRVPHPVEVKQLIAQNGILVEDFVEFSQFKEKDFLIVVLLQVPVLGHTCCEVFPIGGWYVKSGWVILWMIRSTPHFIHNFVWLKKRR